MLKNGAKVTDQNKIIWNLNKNNTSKPRQSTIDKYKLVFNNGKWN